MLVGNLNFFFLSAKLATLTNGNVLNYVYILAHCRYELYKNYYDNASNLRIANYEISWLHILHL